MQDYCKKLHFVIDDNSLSLTSTFSHLRQHVVIDDRKIQPFDFRGHSGGQIQVFDFSNTESVSHCLTKDKVN